jgi:hypothetical protein
MEVRTTIAADPARAKECENSARQDNGGHQSCTAKSTGEALAGHRPADQGEAQDGDGEDGQQHSHPSLRNGLVNKVKGSEQRGCHEREGAKSWSDAWLSKLRDDQHEARAHLAVLMTSAMPKTLPTFGCIDGIWVTNHGCLIGLATALRTNLIELGRARRSQEGKQSKVDLIYHYVGGPEFRQRVEGIVQIAPDSDLLALEPAGTGLENSPF